MKKLLLIIYLATFLTASTGFSQETKQPQPEKKDVRKETTEETFMPHRDIKDIPVPYIMKLDKGETFLFETKGVMVGIITYKGRVDGYSLAESLKNNLIGEKWTLQNSLNYKNTSSLSFVKDQRNLIVFIEEGFFTTKLELRVGLINQ